ncbi:MAG: hypothetical protein AVO35_06830 [Candidatus Aegiribacteria sp. MLS_C]|nr:MAG: hypothetical protein AVO35_06830 [Candidatus Aegiribacteria sp. MLS_C]
MRFIQLCVLAAWLPTGSPFMHHVLAGGIQPPSDATGVTSCTLSVRDGVEDFRADLYWTGPPEVPQGFRMGHTISFTGLESGCRSFFEGIEAYYGSGLGTEGYLVSEDMDFDGYSDLRLMMSPTAGPNTYWYFFLFRPGEGTFQRSLEWEDAGLVSPSFDPVEGMITCFHRGGMGMYGTDEYTVEDGVPVRTRSVTTEYDGADSMVTTVMELVDGRLQVTEVIVEPVE